MTIAPIDNQRNSTMIKQKIGMASKLIKNCVMMYVVFLPMLFLFTTTGVAATDRDGIPSSSSSSSSVSAAGTATTSLFSPSLPLLSNANKYSSVSNVDNLHVTTPKIVLQTTTKSLRQDDEDERIEEAVYSYFFVRGKSIRNSSSSSSDHRGQQTNNSNDGSRSSRRLKKHPSILPSSFDFDFDPNWNYKDPQSWMQFLPFLVLLWVCWCILSCVCNCVRWCCCGGRGGGRGQYHRIGPNQYAYHNTNNNADRPIMNLLWAFCCFEYCCRDNQDIGGGDCCQLCAPLVCLECCCP